MSLQPFFQWCDATAIGEVIRDSRVLFPLIETVHLLALTVLLGTVVSIGLRLLGAGLRTVTVPALARALSPFTHLSLLVMLATGALLFVSEAMKCYQSPPFLVKMPTLATAILFQYTFVASTVRSEDACANRVRAGAAAVGSLVLWFGVAVAGRAIGFY